ncbi:VOC family protein [Amycolatopsis alba]|uniref:VOC family protein n=1 Tax=Amycolatopsis alba DSM 44262 TaxID=1125972 RepID=A0A229RP95_AMYAL|nr:VOC family protein [Amycolatopsis alba]OXM48502.1 VOC family protein [Amycolatopsis alba DSM 44262]
MIDHILYATPDLPATVDELNRRFGVRLSPGGRHLTLGTRNYLADLGGRTYFEVLGPDRDLPDPENGRPLGIDRLTRPRLATWAARVDDVDKVVREAGERGFRFDPVVAMSRDRGDGVRLAWRAAVPAGGLTFGGVVPFLVQWESDAYAAELSVKGVGLVSLTVSHPEAATVREHLALLGLADCVTVGESAEPSLRVTLRTPAGEVALGR